MRLVHASGFAIVVALLMPAVHSAQMQDADRVIKDGGITAPGWQGKVDAAAAKKGMTITASKFVAKGADFEIMTGPATTYWNPSHTATGDFTVTATFKDMKSDAGHPHPAGLFIGGSAMDGEAMNITYCVAYTNGAYLIRQLTGAKAQTLAGGGKVLHDAVKKPDANGMVTNEITWTVKGNRAECLINGVAVGGVDKPGITTDGVYGLRVAHNITTTVTGFSKK